MKNTALLSDREIYKVCKADDALSAAVHKALDLKVGKLPSMKVRERDWETSTSSRTPPARHLPGAPP